MSNKQQAGAIKLGSLASLRSFLGRPEKLHPELASHVYEHPILGRCLQHPLVYSVPYIPEMNATLNGCFRAKRERCAHALKVMDWSMYVIMHEKPYRFQALSDVASLMSDNDFWRLFADTYVGSENWHEPRNRELVDSWLYEERGGQSAVECMMDDDERKVFDALPRSFNVSRGWSRDGGFDGYSWTKDKAIAEWFAKRLAAKGEQTYVAEGRVARRSVYAMFSRRNESEVLVSTPDVAVRRILICQHWHRNDKRPIVSFDFDGTLHHEMEGLDPLTWWTVPKAYEPACEVVRKACATARVVIVTRRDQMQLEPVLDFVKYNELPIEAVYPTSDAPKRSVLGRLRPLAHYDDDPETEGDCPDGTTFVLSKVRRTGRRAK